MSGGSVDPAVRVNLNDLFTQVAVQHPPPGNARRTLEAVIPPQIDGPIRLRVATRGRTRHILRDTTYGKRLLRLKVFK